MMSNHVATSLGVRSDCGYLIRLQISQPSTIQNHYGGIPYSNIPKMQYQGKSFEDGVTVFTRNSWDPSPRAYS